MVPCAHTVVVCVDGGGDPDKQGGQKRWISVLFSGELTHTGIPCTHTVVVCFDWGRGGNPYKHGALKVVFL